MLPLESIAGRSQPQNPRSSAALRLVRVGLCIEFGFPETKGLWLTHSKALPWWNSTFASGWSGSLVWEPTELWSHGVGVGGMGKALTWPTRR